MTLSRPRTRWTTSSRHERHAARSGSDRINTRLLFVESSTQFRTADTDLEALERITRQLERSGFVRQGGLARRNLGLAKLSRDDRSGAADDLIAASTRLLDIDTGAAALGVAALGALASGSDAANTLVAASQPRGDTRAWCRNRSPTPNDGNGSRRWSRPRSGPFPTVRPPRWNRCAPSSPPSASRREREAAHGSRADRTALDAI